MILSALVLGGAAFTAQAQNNLYVAGSFNNYLPDTEGTEWALEPVEDGEEVWKGSITVDSPEFDFYILQNGLNRNVIVPGELVVENGEPEVSPLDEIVPIEFDNGFAPGTCVSAEMALGKWSVSNWDGGNLEIIVDLSTNEITFSASENTPEVEGSGIFLMGDFTDGMDAEWELGTTDAEGVYRGTFNLPEGDIEFYFNRAGRMDIVPGMLVDVDGTDVVTTAEEDVNVVWEGDFF